MRGFRWLATLMVLLVAVPQPAAAKTRVDENFAFPTGQAVKIAVFRPDVQVGSLGMSGVISPNADWTAAARRNFAEALRADIKTMNAETVFIEDTPLQNEQIFADYQSLYRAVAASIFQHKFFGDRLPTKKDRFDWTLGPGAKALGDATGAQYGLLFYTNDAFDSGGRTAWNLLTLNLAGMLLSGVHVAYASLVDLQTGQVVWFNVKLRTGGDPREPEGARERVANLLETLPGRPKPPKVARR